MAKQNEVIENRTHVSRSDYISWLRKIGRHTYRFKVASRSDGSWEIRVDVSRYEGRRRSWITVHQWSND